MTLDRAAKFGSVGAVGVVIISLGTYGLIGMAWTNRISSSPGMALGTMLLVGVAGVGITTLFLFVVIGTFVDRELEARGLDSLEE